VRVLSIVHQPDAGPGVFAEALAASGHAIEEWRPDLRPRPQEAAAAYGAAVVFGGAMHVDHEDRHPWLREEKALLSELVERRTPVLGVCLGAQLLAEAAGGRARPAAAPEIGWREVGLEAAADADPLLGPLPRRLVAFQWHSYEIDPPHGAAVLARSDCCLQAFRADARSWGLQFHAEVTAATVAGWAEDYGEESELRRAGVDRAALSAQTERFIAGSNRLGAELCARFLRLAAEG
jgi:GMP synthase (glutamine-hydrolysing)